MLDPSIPWLAPGYKNFQSEDIPKTQSYDDITKLYHVNQEDLIKKELRSSTPELRQRRRVKSATIQRQLTRQSANDRPPRPKTALGLAGLRKYGWRSSENSPTRPGSDSSPGHSPTRPGSSPGHRERSRLRPGSSQSYYREKVGCYDYTSEHPLPESFIEKTSRPRPKSAILIRHRPSSLDRKSVSLVERQFHKERMTKSVSLEEGDNRCAFCPVESRSSSSSTNRPTSSTGLVAVSLSSHYDRYTFWTRPRTAPSTKREFRQRPRNNYVNRGRIPHYTNFVKRIDLDLRDQTPSPPPRVVRRAFDEPVKPAPPREPRESKPRSQPPAPSKPDPPKEPPVPPPVEPEEPEEKIEEPVKTKLEEPVVVPTPIDEPSLEEEEEVIPPKAASSAWAETRAPTPTPTASPPPEPEEEERIPTSPPPREPTPPPPPEELKPPEPEPPKEPTPPPTPPREPTPPPREPTPPPPEEPPPPPASPPPKPKKEVRIHDPPVTEPPRKLEIKKKEKKAPSLVKRSSITKKSEVKPEPTSQPEEPVKEPEPVTIQRIPVKKEEPKVPKPVVVPSLPQVKTVEEPKPEPEPQEELKPPEEESNQEETQEDPDEGEKKKQLGPPPQKVKVDIFGRSMDPEYMKQLLDLEMKSRRRGNDDDDGEFEHTGNYQDIDPIPDSAMKKSKLESWLKGRMALSKRASRFELPMDVRELEGMSPIAYLERYCIVNRRRAALYRRAFSRVDKDCDLLISQKEMEKAIEDALVDTVHVEQINSVLKLIEAEDDLKIKPKLFSAICALLERLFYHEFVTEDTVEMDGNSKERVEDADFSALDWKLEGCTVNPPLRKLLYTLL